VATAAKHHQLPPTARRDHSPERMAHRGPASTDIVDYCIRSESNHLYEEPDVDEDIAYRIIPGDAVTDEELDICAGNFSSDYGVWSWRAHLVMGMMAEYGKSSGIIGVCSSAAKDSSLTLV